MANPTKIGSFSTGGEENGYWAGREPSLHLRGGRRIGSRDVASRVSSAVGYSPGRARETGNRDYERG